MHMFRMLSAEKTGEKTVIVLNLIGLMFKKDRDSNKIGICIYAYECIL